MGKARVLLLASLHFLFVRCFLLFILVSDAASLRCDFVVVG